MPRTITLPSGATALLRTKREITENMRKPMMLKGLESSVDDVAPAVKAAGYLETLNMTVSTVVISWSYDAPVSADALGDLCIEDVDVLREESRATLQDAMPDFTPDPAPDSPTGPAQVSEPA